MLPVTLSKPDRKQISARKSVISQRKISLMSRVFVMDVRKSGDRAFMIAD